MATTISPVTQDNIKHALLIDLTIGGTTYYISNAYKSIIYGGNTYQELGNFLNLSAMTEDIKTTNGDLQIQLSGIPSNQNYIGLILASNVRGGKVEVYRTFLDASYVPQVTVKRYSGIITNFAIEEDVDMMDGMITKSVSVSVASRNTILENFISGQRTNPTDRNKFYPGDGTFDRVPDLHNVNFDFGREYTGGTGYGGGGGPGGNPFRDITRNFQFR